MTQATSLIRIRFPDDLVARLDRLAERIRVKSKRKIPRAALVRALVKIHMRAEDENPQELADAIATDSVKRGREKRTDAMRSTDRRSSRPGAGGVRGRGGRQATMPGQGNTR